MSAKDVVKQIIELDDKIALLRESFEGFTPAEQEDALVVRFEEGIAAIKEDGAIAPGLVRVTEMLLTLGSDRAVDTLGKGMSHLNVDVRMLSADALLHVAEEDFSALSRLVDKAIAEGGVLGAELPFLLMEVENKEVPKTIARFLAHKEADVVAAAIEALSEVGDETSLAELTKLKKDKRKITVEEEDGKTAEWTIGQLAEDAIEMLNDQEE